MANMTCVFRKNEYEPSSVDLYKKLAGNLHMVHRLASTKPLKVHQGCVNSIAWNDSGEYILSGSDDKKLVITNPFNHRVAARIPSGHKRNIYCAKFLPGTANKKIVSCAGGGVIHYTQLDAPSMFGKCPFTCHSSTTYQVVTTPGDSNSFLSSSEDGTIRWFDLRETTSCVKEQCQDHILIDCKRSVIGLTVDPVRSYYLAAGTSDGLVRIYDRRMLNAHTVYGTHSAVKCFKPTNSKSGKVTYLQYSSTGSHLLANCSPKYVYEIDTQNFSEKVLDTPTITCPTMSTPDDSSASSPVRVRLRGDWTGTGPSSVLESQRTETSMSSSELLFHHMSVGLTNLLQNRRTQESADRSGNNEHNRVSGESVEQSSAEELNSETGASTETDSSQTVTNDNEKPIQSNADNIDSSRPTISNVTRTATNEQINNTHTKSQIHGTHHMICSQEYEGHRNSRTAIKQCRYWGDNLVLAGSDCGHIFIWERHSGKLIDLLVADSRVVNCILPHPHYLMMASSGIDHDIKLWLPTKEDVGCDKDRINTITQKNKQLIEEQGDSVTIPANFLIGIMRMLSRSQQAAGQDEEAQPDGD